MPSRSALFVATDSYSDKGLNALVAPEGDCERFAAVLRNPDVGNFDDVEILHNEPEHMIRRRVGRFFGDRHRDDFLVLYVAGHGVKQSGHLYFAAADTELTILESTAVGADFVNRLVDRCRARRIVMLLDCCYSGAFARGMVPRSGESLDLEEHLGGTGRAVLTASTATEQAFEAGEPQGEGRTALFTDALIEGLETGEADVDNDGEISIAELYEYVLEHVRARNPDQTPRLWQFETEGEMVIAKRPRRQPVDRPAAADAGGPGHWFEADPLWYQRAVFYEIDVASYFDGNGDGTGDLRGLVEKLDYLQWLGVDCLALSALYPHRELDGRPCATALTGVAPEFGHDDDLPALLEGAHQRGIRVVMDFALSSTSVEHPWFVDPTRRDWYVRSESTDRLEDAAGFYGQRAAWSWDGAAGCFFWHRRSSAEPSLNYDNPEVGEAVVDALRWWLDHGLDGFRLLGADELFAREGTLCLGLPETHEFLRLLRAEVDAQYPGRVLIAHTLAWPEDAARYFGDGDGCHMVSNFLLPPALLLAMRLEEAAHLSEALFTTPPIPSTGQWAMFLRDGDPVRLDLLADEPADALMGSLTTGTGSELLLGEYAKDPRARHEGGLRRRLAPLLDNSRRAQDLVLALLFAAPGSPFLYYGDELGMGDNLYLEGIHGLRTPMQWTGDRNAGFSRADVNQIATPVIGDPVYGYQVLNVEAQLRTPYSLLRESRRTLSLRKELPAFATGDVELLNPDNRAVLALVRRLEEDDPLLCVFNLSRTPTPATLDLSAYRGLCPIELFGHTRFPLIGDDPYQLTLSAQAFLWFRLADEVV